MAEFGSTSRADITQQLPEVGTPTVKKAAPTAVLKDVKQPDAIDAVVAQNNLGNALTGYLDETVTSVQAKNRAKGAAIVGNRRALTEVEQASEHTGWEKYLYGKDATHQGMQQAAAANRLRGDYNMKLAAVSESANITPEEYYRKLQGDMQKVLEEYKDDPSTRSVIATQMQKDTEKLVNAQTKEHYGWKQQEGNRLFQEDLQQRLDGFTLEKIHTITPEEQVKFGVEILKTLDGAYQPKTMTDEARRTATLDVVMKNMRTGNAGALLAAQAAELDADLSLGEQVKWDAALRDYDTQYFNKIATINSTADLQITLATLPHQIDAAASQQLLDLEELAKQSSGSPYAIKQMGIAEAEWAKNHNKEEILRKKLEADALQIADKAAKAKAKLEEQAKKDAALAAYHQTPDGGKKAALDGEWEFTRKELEDSFDTHILKNTQSFTESGKIPTIAEFGEQLRTNPKLQEYVTSIMSQNAVSSPMVTTIMSTVTNGTDNLYDADGKVTEVGLQSVAMMNNLARSDKFVDMIGGKAKAREWHLRSRGIKSGQGQGATDKYIDSWRNNTSKKDAAGYGWKQVLGEAKDRRSWMRNKLIQEGIPNPTATQITDNLQDYADDMTAFTSLEDADHMFKQRLRNNVVTIHGHKLHDAKYLDSVTKWTADGLLRNMENHNLMAGQLAVLTGKDTTIRHISQIPNARVYTKEGIRGIFISSPTAAQEAFISEQEMREAEVMITQRNEIERIKRERTLAAKEYAKQREMHGLSGIRN